MNSLEKVGKSVDDAVQMALNELGVTINAVDVKVLEQGSKGFFGIGFKPSKVLVTVKFDPELVAKKFLIDISETIGISMDIITTMNDRNLDIELIGGDASVFIGKHGQTLDSLQYLLNLVVNKGNAPYINLSLDTGNYRQKRKETLENLAYNLAKKAKQTRKKVTLEPMTSNERRVIHAALQNDKSVSTHSEGEDPYRNVVIIPKDR